MKKAWFIVLAFCLGFAGVFGYLYLHRQIRPSVVFVSSSTVSSPPEPTFALEPPSGAIEGALTVVNGHVKKFSRGDTEYKEASTGARILIGESVATTNNSSASVVIPNIALTELAENAELVYANMFPKNFVLQQKAGVIRYVITTPISVRALHTLVSLSPGDTDITIFDTDVSVSVKTGSAKLGLVDLDNTTQVLTVSAGERANISDATRLVRLIHVR